MSAAHPNGCDMNPRFRIHDRPGRFLVSIQRIADRRRRPKRGRAERRRNQPDRGRLDPMAVERAGFVARFRVTRATARRAVFLVQGNGDVSDQGGQSPRRRAANLSTNNCCRSSGQLKRDGERNTQVDVGARGPVPNGVGDRLPRSAMWTLRGGHIAGRIPRHPRMKSGEQSGWPTPRSPGGWLEENSDWCGEYFVRTTTHR